MPVGAPHEDCGTPKCIMKRVKKREFRCTVKILIRPGASHDSRGATMTLGVHEAWHAVYFAKHFEKTVAAIHIAGGWCLPPKCSEIRDNYIRALIAVYDAERYYLDAKLHATDYPTSDERSKWRRESDDWRSTLNDRIQEASRFKQELKRCMSEAQMIEPRDWPSLEATR